MARDAWFQCGGCCGDQAGSMMGHRQKLKKGSEWDLLTEWKNLLCYMQRPGVKKRIKSDMRRRDRREGKRAIDEER